MVSLNESVNEESSYPLRFTSQFIPQIMNSKPVPPVNLYSNASSFVGKASRQAHLISNPGINPVDSLLVLDLDDPLERKKLKKSPLVVMENTTTQKI